MQTGVADVFELRELRPFLWQPVKVPLPPLVLGTAHLAGTAGVRCELCCSTAPEFEVMFSIPPEAVCRD